MRILVCKPQGGKVRVVVDDRQGLTGIQYLNLAVHVVDLVKTVEAALYDWEETRKSFLGVKRSAWLDHRAHECTSVPDKEG